jgi:hypothetical protein
MCARFCVKEVYSRKCVSIGRLLGQAWWMWRPIRAAGMVAQVREGRENRKGELVGWEKGWARHGFSILMSFQIVSYLI